MAQTYEANSNDAQADHVMEEKAQSKEIDALEDGPNGSLASDSVPNNGVQASLDGGQVPIPEAFENVAQSNGEKKGGAGSSENTVPPAPQENGGSVPENPNIRMSRLASVSRGYGAYGRGNAQTRGRGFTTRGIAQTRGRGFAARGYRGQAGSGPRPQSTRRFFKMHHRVSKEELEAKVEVLKLLYGEDHYLVIKYESYLISLREAPANSTYLINDTYVTHDMEPVERINPL